MSVGRDEIEYDILRSQRNDLAEMLMFFVQQAETLSNPAYSPEAAGLQLIARRNLEKSWQKGYETLQRCAPEVYERIVNLGSRF